MSSRGAKKLKLILEELYGSNTIIEEYHLGAGLRLDYYIPSLMLGFEFHGRQHREFVEHFHGDIEGFRLSKNRDANKIDKCAEQRIALVTVWFDDNLTKDLVGKRALQALRALPEPPKREPKQEDEYTLKRREKAREARKQRYQWLKQLKKQNKK